MRVAVALALSLFACSSPVSAPGAVQTEPAASDPMVMPSPVDASTSFDAARAPIDAGADAPPVVDDPDSALPPPPPPPPPVDAGPAKPQIRCASTGGAQSVTVTYTPNPVFSDPSVIDLEWSTGSGALRTGAGVCAYGNLCVVYMSNGEHWSGTCQ